MEFIQDRPLAAFIVPFMFFYKRCTLVNDTWPAIAQGAGDRNSGRVSASLPPCQGWFANNLASWLVRGIWSLQHC